MLASLAASTALEVARLQQQQQTGQAEFDRVVGWSVVRASCYSVLPAQLASNRSCCCHISHRSAVLAWRRAVPLLVQRAAGATAAEGDGAGAGGGGADKSVVRQRALRGQLTALEALTDLAGRRCTCSVCGELSLRVCVCVSVCVCVCALGLCVRLCSSCSR